MREEEKAFGQVLRQIRIRKQLSQETLGFEAELARNFISQIELGSKSPSLRTIFRLCKVLDVDPSELLRHVEVKLRR